MNVDPVQRLLERLNAAQREAVLHTGSPLLVLAGPGSGKTRVLTHRVAHRVATGTPPQSIVAITFTNRAAAELRQRLQQLVGTATEVRAGTFHWMCNALLRRYADRIDLRRNFVLLTPRQSRLLVRDVARELGYTEAGAWQGMAEAIGRHKNGDNQAIDGAPSPSDPAVGRVFQAYSSRLTKQNALDLDDLLWQTSRLLDGDPELRRMLSHQVAELAVDEFQDVNPVQQLILRLLVPASGNVLAVGDDDQAIYGWRQATPASMLDFRENFPGARLITLEDTYRCSKHILRTAAALVSHNAARYDKTLRTGRIAGRRPVCYVAQDERDEAEWVAARIDTMRERDGLTPGDFAVLYRVNAQSRAIEDALLRRNIPYRVLAGHRFYDRPEVRACVAYLRLAGNDADDDAAAYLLGRVGGIGPRRVEGLRLEAHAKDIALSTLLRSSFTMPLPSPVRRAVESLGSRIERVRAVRTLPVRAVLDEAIAVTRDELSALLGSAELEAALDDLSEVRSLVGASPRRDPALHELVDMLSLGASETSSSDVVNLLTLHAAKGLEFPAVFLLGLEEGLLPHRRALESEAEVEEERRLCYVGMTRAADFLSLSYAHVRFLGGRALAGGRSRFVAEVGGNVDMIVSPLAAQRPRLSGVEIGDRVRHTRWQDGTVVRVEGAGRDTFVTIQFDAVGKQRLQLCHAPLTFVEGKVPDVRAG